MSRTLVLTPPSMARTDRVNPGDCNVQSVVGKSSTSLARAVVVHSSSDRLEPEVDTGGETAADEAVKQNGKFTSAAFEGNLGRRSIGLRFEAGEKLDRLDRAERRILRRGSLDLERAGSDPIRNGKSRRRKLGSPNLESAGGGPNSSKALNPESAGRGLTDDEVTDRQQFWIAVPRPAQGRQRMQRATTHIGLRFYRPCL